MLLLFFLNVVAGPYKQIALTNWELKPLDDMVFFFDYFVCVFEPTCVCVCNVYACVGGGKLTKVENVDCWVNFRVAFQVVARARMILTPHLYHHHHHRSQYGLDEKSKQNITQTLLSQWLVHTHTLKHRFKWKQIINISIQGENEKIEKIVDFSSTTALYALCVLLYRIDEECKREPEEESI